MKLPLSFSTCRYSLFDQIPPSPLAIVLDSNEKWLRSLHEEGLVTSHLFLKMNSAN